MKKLNPSIHASVEAAILHREFTTFFTMMLAPAPGFRAPNDEQFIEALASSIVAAGDRSGRGIAILQTMVFELQAKIDAKLNPAPSKTRRDR